MDSLLFNKAHNISAANQKVSFTGQRSVMDATGDGIYRFYAPPYDDEKYLLALELVSVDNETDSKGHNTGKLHTDGQSTIVEKSVNCFRSSVNGIKLSYDVSEKDLKAYGLNKDIVGYRFVLLDKETYDKKKNVNAAIEAAKWTDDNGHKHTSYLLDSGRVASACMFEDYSYFSKKQGFVNKIGPMYHIMPDSYNAEEGNEDFVRSPFNKAGGDIQGLIQKIKDNKELSPYEMVITTPLFGGDDISSHGYWTANPFQIASTKGTLEDFKDLQTAIFDEGKSYVTDGAFTSFGLQAPQLHHVLKHGEASPFYNWMKFDKTDSPNLKIKLGVLPDAITPPNNKDKDPEGYKKSQVMLDNTRFKVVNPKYIESDANDRASKRKPNPAYDETKPTYIQFYDNRLAGSEANDIENLITFYEKQTPDNHYDIATHHDSVQPFYFEVDPADKRFQTRGASLKQLQEEGINYDTFFQMGHYTITTKSSAGGANTWDGQVDLIKANIANPTEETALGNKQVKNYFYNIASYWTKLTDDALIEHIAQNIHKKGNAALNDIAKKHRLSPAAVSKDTLSHVIGTKEFNKNFNKKFEGKSDSVILLDAIVDFPLESIEFAPDLTAVLSMPTITPRPSNKNANENVSKAKLLEKMPSNAQSLYRTSMYEYLRSVLSKLDAKMPAGQKIFKNGNIDNLTEYGRFVSDIVAADIMKYGVVQALFPEEELVRFDNEGKAEYDENLKYKGLAGLGINCPGKPENEANELLGRLIDGFSDLKKADNTELVDALHTRFKDVKLDDIKMAKAVVNITGAGLNWRFDAAKDVADLDRRRANDPLVKFEDCWDSAIDFWGGFIQNIRKHNPAAYTVAEVTNLWEFSRHQGSNKNLFALRNIENLETLNTSQQKYVLYEFYMANKDRIGDEGKADNEKPSNIITPDVRKSLEGKKNITVKELEQNPALISDREFMQLRKYYGIAKENGELKKYLKIANEAMQLKDFGKYIDPNNAERMLYEKTGATTGSNYSTFFPLYPELFGQNFEFGTTDHWNDKTKGIEGGRLYNMKEFENGLKGFFKENSPQFINQNHIFVGNHDKPRPLHCMALDMDLFLSDLRYSRGLDDKPAEKSAKEAEYKTRANKVTRSSDYDHVSSMAVAVGEKYLKMFEESYNGNISREELETVKQAIADLAAGRFLDNTAGSMANSRTFGYLPFDITLQDVIRQARYLSENKGMKWSISQGKKSGDKKLSAKEEKLFNETFSKLEPDTEKLSAMLRMMMFSVGIPTIFAGDEMAHSGHEAPTKNVELAIRNIVHHSWIDDKDKKFVRKLYNQITAAANVHRMRGLSALADGSPLVVPQKSDGDDENNASHTALFKYNEKGSNVLVVYSNKRMDTENKDPLAHLNKEKEEIDHIDLEYIDAYGNPSGKRVAKAGDKYAKLEYDEKLGKYVQSKETYVVNDKGKLIREKIATNTGISNPRIVLDDVANVFFKVN